MNNNNIRIFSDKKSLAVYFGDVLSQLSINKKEVFVALSGGSTPKAIFHVLSHEYKAKIDWSVIKFFWGDERLVPPSDPESNFGMTREHLFDHVGTKAINIFRVKGELDPDSAIDDYTRLIKENVPAQNDLPQFDLTLLGLGDDGHTASIFPHQLELWNSDNTCELAQHPQSGQNRVTLSGKIINNSKQIILMVTGKNKAEIVKNVFLQNTSSRSYPVSLLNPNKCQWFLDKDAASLL